MTLLTTLTIHDARWSRNRALWTGPESGHFTLPDSLTAAALKVHRINTAMTQIPEPAETAVENLYAEILHAAGSEEPEWPTADPILEERRQREAHAILIRGMGDAAEVAMNQLWQELGTSTPTILAQHLKPALDETINRARTILTNYRKADGLTENETLQAPKAVRDAVIEMRDLAERYAHIRRAAALIKGRTDYDDRGIFAEARNIVDVVGIEEYDIAYRMRRPLLPADPLERLVHLASNPFDIWLPTAAEQDQAARDFHENRPSQHQRR